MDREGPSLGQMIFNLVTRGESEPDSVPEIFAVALEALPRLTAVTKLSVVHDYTGAWRDDPLIQQVIRCVWQFIGDRLRFLKVRVALENLERLLPTSLHLPYLKILAVNAEGYSRVADNAGEFIISTMIQSHSSSLRDVSFTTKNTAIDLRRISQSLQHLPRLQAIHLSLPFGPVVPHPLPAYDLLYSCRRHLEVLSLDFENYTREDALTPLSIFRERWCYVDLPHVRDLRINPPIKDFGREFIEYIHRFAPSLISLSINLDLNLNYSDVELLSSIFHDFLSLQNLSICTRCFCPDILALLARTLPCLRTLNLTYSYISTTTGREGQLWNKPEQARLVS